MAMVAPRPLVAGNRLTTGAADWLRIPCWRRPDRATASERFPREVATPPTSTSMRPSADHPLLDRVTRSLPQNAGNCQPSKSPMTSPRWFSAQRRCGRARCGSRCGRSSGPHTRVTRWEPGTRPPPTPTERCPCWKRPDTNGYAHWRDARPYWSRQPAENGPPPKTRPSRVRPTGRLRTHGRRRRTGPGTPGRRPQRS